MILLLLSIVENGLCDNALFKKKYWEPFEVWPDFFFKIQFHFFTGNIHNFYQNSQSSPFYYSCGSHCDLEITVIWLALL